MNKRIRNGFLFLVISAILLVGASGCGSKHAVEDSVPKDGKTRAGGSVRSFMREMEADEVDNERILQEDRKKREMMALNTREHAVTFTNKLAEERKAFQTKLAFSPFGEEPLETPPEDVFRVVHYDSVVGPLAAYLTPDPGDGKRHPAILWISGGDCNSICDVWSPVDPDNDQTARAYRDAGIVMMFPSLRGGNENPGRREGCFGEVDDVLAAADFLAAQPFVDPDRVYLGGHSTGGTLALLTAEISPRFRAVFSFGPIDEFRKYPPIFCPFDRSFPPEYSLRSPIYWLHGIKSAVFVFEGTRGGNHSALQNMRLRNFNNPIVRFYSIKNGDHFNILAPTNALIAQKILADTEKRCGIFFTDREVAAVMAEQ